MGYHQATRSKVEQNKMMTFIYDERFDQFDTWEILGSGPIRFIHENSYSVSFGSDTYFLIYGVFMGKDRWTSIDMEFQGWACDIKHKEMIELIGGAKKWISILP